MSNIKSKVKMKEFLSIMETGRSPVRTLANLPEDFALWLYYRRTIGERVPTVVAGDLIEGIGVSQINNFFSDYYGIGKETFKSIEDLYKKLNNKRKNDPKHRTNYPQISCPDLGTIEKMLAEMEEKYGELADRKAAKINRR